MSTTSTALQRKRDTIDKQARGISQTFHKDVLAILSDKSTIDEAELDTILAYLKAVALVSNTNTYKAMKEAALKPRHCLRCHGSFTEDDNGPRACVIPHVFDGEDYRRSAGGITYISRCCGEGATVFEDPPGNGVYEDFDQLGKCFVGRHTTQEWDVILHVTVSTSFTASLKAANVLKSSSGKMMTLFSM
ncbi:hypothetical protein M413DRAFT_438833 [Hebeloma cylindrosporum]|uniref:Uncharacterized protein n=1 Tax=Hebeloma cylindrosporum TaxID=76867 RepID=A0A0C3CLV8_HEBCY|nr:hypothetical protein M413DRAFT_438833 [Hebeloma cylindrosporum h7]